MNKLLLATAAGSALSLAGFVTARVRTRVIEARNPPKGRTLTIEGRTLHVLQRGAGPDVVLIHGAAMMADEMMAALGDELADYRVTAIDRPSHGHSGRRRRPSLIDQAEDVMAAVQALGLHRPVLVGQSLGGAVALACGALFPSRIAGVVAVAPLAYPGWGLGHLSLGLRAIPGVGVALSNTSLALLDPLMLRAALRPIFGPQKPSQRFRDAVDVGMLSRPSALVADGADFIGASRGLQRLSRDYAAYPAPLHVLVGGKDRILKPRRQGERLARAVPGARLTRLEGLGHMLHHFAPEAVRLAVEDVRARGLPAETPALRPAAA